MADIPADRGEAGPDAVEALPDVVGLADRPLHVGSAERPVGAAPSAGTAELARGLVPQLAEAVARSPDRPVEVTLAPEELGRVRLTLHATDAGLTMSVLADRPETLDLMRRHIDQLARDFRDLGFANLSFSFGQRRDGSTPAPQPRLAAAPPEPEAAVSPVIQARPAPTRPLPDAAAGLDLRI